MFTLYSADITGNPGTCSYPHRHDVTDRASLKAAISHDYVCAEYKNHYRNGDNFIGSDCLPVDCDNDHSEEPADWITPDDVAAAFPGVSFAVHYSRFHNREKNGKPARPNLGNGGKELRLQAVQGIPGKGRTKEVLQLVGLWDGRKSKCKELSMGMKQRLGLAIAFTSFKMSFSLRIYTNGLYRMDFLKFIVFSTFIL